MGGFIRIPNKDFYIVFRENPNVVEFYSIGKETDQSFIGIDNIVLVDSVAGAMKFSMPYSGHSKEDDCLLVERFLAEHDIVFRFSHKSSRICEGVLTDKVACTKLWLMQEFA